MVDLDVRALVLDDVGKVVDVEVLLDPPVDRGLVHVGDVLELARRIVEREHGTVDKGFAVPPARERQQVVGALEALREDAHVVIHEKHVREALVRLERRDHAPCEAAGTAHVLVGDHGDEAIGETRGVERPAVVHHEHVEVAGYGIGLVGEARTHELDVGDDVVLLPERRGGERETNVVHVCLVHLRVVVRGQERDGLGARDELEGHQVHAACRKLDVIGDPTRHRRAVGRVEGQRRERPLVIRLAGGHAHDAQVAADGRRLEVKPDPLHPGIPAPLDDGTGVEIGEKVGRPAHDEGGGALVVRDGTHGAIVEVGMRGDVIGNLEHDV